MVQNYLLPCYRYYYLELSFKKIADTHLNREPYKIHGNFELRDNSKLR
jgi:hypothetical protein